MYTLFLLLITVGVLLEFGLEQQLHVKASENNLQPHVDLLTS